MIRFFDILLSFIGLLLLSPLFIFIALLILLESQGGIFYEQTRIGKNFIPFSLYKFRSMYVGSDKKGLLTIGANDNRITKIGTFIRKYKLDELPQLFNVLKGDMSLVGPRPEVKKYVDLYTDEQKAILLVRPGITDLASIEYSNENEILALSDNAEKLYVETIMGEKIKLNYEFIKNPSVINYFSIIFKTIFNKKS